MLFDLYGFFKRNLKMLNEYQKQKIKKELLAIVELLDNS